MASKTMKKSGKSGKSSGGGGGGGGVYVVQSKLRELIKKGKMKCSSCVFDAVNSHLGDTVGRAIKRAQANGRRTLRGSDF